MRVGGAAVGLSLGAGVLLGRGGVAGRRIVRGVPGVHSEHRHVEEGSWKERERERW